MVLWSIGLIAAMSLTATGAAALDPQRAITQYQVTAFDETSGLLGAGISALTADDRGFLWVATDRGLVRFDGRGAERAIFPDRTPRLITEVLWSQEGRLWAGTLEGLFVSEPHQRALSPIQLPLTHPPLILSLQEDPAGLIWVGTDEGLFVFRNGRFELVSGRTRMTYGAVHSLAVARRPGQLWVGTDDGLFHLDLNHFHQLRNEPVSDALIRAPVVPAGTTVRSLTLNEEQQTLWAGTSDGELLRLSIGDTPRLEQRQRLGTTAVTTLLVDRDGLLWAGLEHRGLARRSESAITFLNPSNALVGSNVTSLVEDRDGNLWIGVEDGALHRISNGEITVLSTWEGLASNFLRTLARGPDGGLWIGTENSGLNYLKDGRVTHFTTADGLASNAVLALAIQDGDLWIGTTGGLNRLRGARPDATALTIVRRRDQASPTQIAASPVVLALEPSSSGGLWVGTTSGLLRYTSQTGLETAIDPSPWSQIRVRSLLETPEGVLWVGTEGGLLRLIPEVATSTLDTLDRSLDDAIFGGYHVDALTREAGLAGDYVLDIHRDETGVLWVGSIGGLTRIAGPPGREKILSFGVGDGLHNDVLHAVTEDHQGRFWLCSNRGLFRVSRQQLEAKAAGAPDPITSRVLQGTLDRVCDGNNHPTHVTDDDGTLLLASAGGLLVLDPAAVEARQAPPKVMIEEVLADGVPLDLQPVLALPAGTRDVEFQFAVATLSFPRGTTFLYRLSHRDAEWIETSEPFAAYTNFPRGHSRLEVLVRDGNGATSTSPTTIKLVLAPPILLRPSNLSLMLLLTLVLGRGFYQIRFRQLLEQNRKLENRVSRRTAQIMEQRDDLERASSSLKEANQQLQSANRELSLRNRENTELLSMAAHDLRRPLLNLRVFAGEIRTTLERLTLHVPSLSKILEPGAIDAFRQAFDTDAPEALSYVDASTERMDQLISALLALSQVGRQRLEPQVIELDELVDETLRSLTYQISRDNVRIEKQQLPPVWADRQALKQILENLLNNAVTYLSPERRGQVTIAAEEVDEEVIIHVRDNGRGIADQQRHKVFKIFGRAGSPDIPGEGLGLAFVRTLVERHGGRIWFISELGVGTTFSFCLPKRRDDVPLSPNAAQLRGVAIS